MSIIKDVLGDGLDFSAIPGRIRNGEAVTTLVAGDLVVHDIPLTSAIATNFKVGDSGSALVVAILSAVALDGVGWFSVVRENIAPGNFGRVWYAHPALLVKQDATSVLGIGMSAGVGVLDSSAATGAKVIAIPHEATANAKCLVSFNGVDGFGNP